MKKIIYSIFLLLLLPLIANSQNQEGNTIKLYYLMATTPWDISINRFDSTFIDSKYCRSVTLHEKLEVSKFLLELKNLQDTIIDNKNNKEIICRTPDCKQVINSVPPPMDTRGKLILTTPNGDEVFYYSLNIIWNSTNNLSYKMNEKLRKMIINKFIPQ